MEDQNQNQEISAEELDNVAGGAAFSASKSGIKSQTLEVKPTTPVIEAAKAITTKGINGS